MKKKIVSLLLVALLAVNLSGCVGALIIGGAAGALGAYAVSKDTIQGETDKSYEKLWNAALIVSKIRGSVTQEDSLHGIINLDAEASKVNIRLIRLTRATTRLRISARKMHLPNFNLAQDLFTKIMEQAQ